MKSLYQEIPTPALLVDETKLKRNILKVQAIADAHHVSLRPHTKTHKMPYIAKMQEEAGARGIAVAKTAEAEIMAQNGLKDIFIANEPAGADKLERLAKLSREITLSFGVDCVEHIRMAEETFRKCESVARVLAEIEVGENRSGVVDRETFRKIIDEVKKCEHVEMLGVFSHDGYSYGASSREDAKRIGVEAQKKTLEFAAIMSEEGIEPQVVSIGSTTSILCGCDILPGITEIRIGTYIFMDGSQSPAVGDETCEDCAATVLLTAVSKPTDKRIVFDGGAKSLTMQKRTVGITANPGLGRIVGFPNSYLIRLYDEHAITEDQAVHDAVGISEKVEIIPNHICPVVNLYRKAYLVNNGTVIQTIPILCAGATE